MQGKQGEKILMNNLKIEFSENGLFLQQVKRTQHTAMYSVHLEKGSPITGYEVIRIRIIPEEKIKGTIIPEHERYPGNEKFGKDGFSWITREQAERCFSEMENHYAKGGEEPD